MLLHRLQKDGLIHPPKFLADNTHYLTVMGSVAYGCSNDMSDMDCYGFAIPPKELTFPHLAGEIPGFGQQVKRFEQYQEHHVRDTSSGKEYDFAVYSIVKYFQLLMENNPNIVDSLFTARRLVLHMTDVGEMVREHRKLFLHRGSFHKFKGYAYAQLAKVKGKKASENEKRQASIDAHGYDVKAASHVVRLALECQQILTEGDLDLERNSEQLRAIRRGEWTVERLDTFFEEKERYLEALYADSPLPVRPDEAKIKDLLLKCLEHHYGNLSSAVHRKTEVDEVLKAMQDVIDRYAA